eukprot:2052416-Rhodomonas_salina.1
MLGATRCPVLTYGMRSVLTCVMQYWRAVCGGKSPEEYMARKVAWVLDQVPFPYAPTPDRYELRSICSVAPVCRERGLGYEMALMEVLSPLRCYALATECPVPS